jgi:hypothetical protein
MRWSIAMDMDTDWRPVLQVLASAIALVRLVASGGRSRRPLSLRPMQPCSPSAWLQLSAASVRAHALVRLQSARMQPFICCQVPWQARHTRCPASGW